MKKRIVILVLLLIAIAAAVWFYKSYQDTYTNNVAEDVKLFVPTGATVQQVYDSVATKVIDLDGFKSMAQRKGFKKVFPGRYSIKKGDNNKQILSMLMTGKQDEIDLTIGNYGSVLELASKVAPYLELEDDDLLAAIAKRKEVQGLDTALWIYFLAPNTYYFHWNTTGDEFVNKLAEQYHKYWTDANKKLLSKSILSELEAITLASIVQLESYKPDEQPRVAGLYLNRLKIGMKLDADPTVIFAKKQKEGWLSKIQRVYYKDLNSPSPYNTYRNRGLPPGPICMPNPTAIDAVLQPAASTYIFFVADPSRPGYHLYATTLAEQEKNAKVYRDWLDKQKIK